VCVEDQAGTDVERDMKGRDVEVSADTLILEQVREHWEKMFTLLLWKLKREGVTTISVGDMQDYHAKIGDRVLLTHGKVDSISYSFVSREEARTILAWDAEHVGHA